MPTREFFLDPITKAVKTMMEGGVSKEIITGTLRISDEDLHQHLNYLYARTFDIHCRNWHSNDEYNKTFIKAQEQYLNDKLRAHGYLFLNEVYEALGMPRSAQGQIVGWFWEPGSHPVEFDIVDKTVNGGFIIAFNPDGVIYNKLPTF
jgi:hypothetical protein